MSTSSQKRVALCAISRSSLRRRAAVSDHETRLSRGARLAALVSLGALSIAVSAAPPAGSPGAQQPAGQVHKNDPQQIHWVKGRVLVQPRAGLSEKDLDKILGEHGGRRAQRISQINTYIVQLPEGTDEAAVAKALKGHPHIKFAELDRAVEPNLTLNDQYFPNEWHLTQIGAPTAWNATTGSSVIIAVLDSGVDASHPDLTANLVPGWNFSDNNSNTSDVSGHGTAVAGIASAVGNNSVGVAGVSFGSKIMPLRITDSTGYAWWSMVAQGITYAADHGARVANVSYEGACCSSTIISAAQYLRSKGGVLTASAGNDGTLMSYTPSDYVTTVSATDSSDAFASFSAYGNYVDVAAPGVGIWTTTMGGGYAALSGTSGSAPLTAGVYALMLAANPKLAPSTLDSILFKTALDLGSSGYDMYYGWGRVNAAAAVAQAQQTVATDTTAPTVSIGSPGPSTKVSGLVPISVSASDNVGVTRVDLLVNGTVYASDTTAPFGFSWDTTTLPDGSATLQAKAYDAAGNVGASGSVSVTVANDTIPPTVTIASPVSGAVVSGSVAISVSATDNNKVSQISLSIDGQQVALSYGSTLSYTWSVSTTSTATSTTTSKGKGKKLQTSTTTIQSGTSHTITAIAMDPAGNQGSASVTVTVQ
jgi:thermitase